MELSSLHHIRVKERIKAVLEQGGADFDGLVRQCGGAYPTDLRNCLRELQDAGEVVFHDHNYELIRSTSSYEQRPPSMCDEENIRLASIAPDALLAAPHPVDYDWRFTAATRAMLISRICRLTRTGDLVGVFGAPSLFLTLIEVGIEAVLVDRNELLCARLGEKPSGKVICSDLFAPLVPELHCKVVVADPPWYPEFYEAFILRSAESLAYNGLLLLSVLPWLTRPSALADRAHILNFCHRAGFDLVSAETSLSYDSPPFERASLQKQGLVLGQWRSGDLYTFRRVAAPEDGLQTVSPREGLWRTFELYGNVIKVRECAETTGPFTFMAVTGGDPVLTSVSRRAPERNRINLWTSHNKAYAITRTDIIIYALRALGEGDLRSSVNGTAAAFSLTDRERVSISVLLGDLLMDSRQPLNEHADDTSGDRSALVDE